MRFAPIAITVYDRLDCFKRCIAHLKKNLYANKSSIFVYSDGALKTKDNVKVNEIRDYVKKIRGFKSVKLIAHNKNFGSFQNSRIALKEMSNNFVSFIILEDDIITSPKFLKFVNEALIFYNNSQKVLSVSGYNIPFFKNESELYKSHFFNGWGVGFWSKKLLLQELDNVKKPYLDMLKNGLKSKVKKIHPKLPVLLKKIDNGKDLTDIHLTYLMIKNNWYQIRPIKSLTKNVGFDGRGVNSGVDQRFLDSEFSDETVVINNDFEYKLSDDKQYYFYFNPKINFISKIFLILYKLKRKLRSIFLR